MYIGHLAEANLPPWFGFYVEGKSADCVKKHVCLCVLYVISYALRYMAISQ